MKTKGCQKCGKSFKKTYETESYWTGRLYCSRKCSNADKCIGRVLKNETKEKIRLANLGSNNHNYGKKMSAKQRKDISAAHKKLVSEGTHHLWKGGVSTMNQIIRQSVEYKLWREAVFKRDNYCCVWCGARSGKGTGRIFIEADHIKPFAQFPELRFAIDNGRTLCAPCHRTTDSFGKNL